MPQNPLDLLNKLMVKPPSSTFQGPVDQRAWDAEAAKKQANDPLWKKAGRGLFDLVTDGIAGDPFAEGSENKSWGSKLGMLAAAAPLGIPKNVGAGLKAIAPEAYNDVRAGGLRLYSRLTDAFANAPKQMMPGKIRSIAQQGASAEEVSLRKLEDFLKGRPEMAKIPREEVMNHLAANPLELDVVRKGQITAPKDVRPPANEHEALSQQLRQIEHELDTQYGNGWNLTTIEHPDRQRWNAVNDRLQREFGGSIGEWEPDGQEPRYDWLQTPGPKENYGETLFNLPGATPEGRLSAALPPKHQDPNLTFQSDHWNEPNNLVWSRHNDRMLNPDSVDLNYTDGYNLNDDQTATGGSKGRFIEEIQSDWHQQGREHGYKSDPYPDMKINMDHPNGPAVEYGDTAYFPQEYVGDGPTDEQAFAEARRDIDKDRAPDAPFKNTYHELALKQQLLDAADDPSLEWLGVADADTVSKTEGHIPYLGDTQKWSGQPGDPGIRPGMELYYNEKHPTALEKLLKPFGGIVEYANLPGPKLGGMTNEVQKPMPDTNWGNRQIIDINSGQRVATALTDSPTKATRFASESLADDIGKREIPGEGMWKANLTPELKALIKKRGFPAMTALAALQQSLSTDKDKQ
jgi:hypothetical protein